MVEVSKPSAVVVVTPSSVIPPVVLRALPKVDAVRNDDDEKKANVTVSHSFSVVSVQYSTATDDLESPPPTLRWGELTDGKAERGDSLPEFESGGGGGDLEMPITAGLDLDYDHTPESEEGKEETEDEKGGAERRPGPTEASAVLPGILKVEEIEGLAYQKNIHPQSLQDDHRYEFVNSDSSEPKLDQRAFELDYYVEDVEERQNGKVGGDEMDEAESNADYPYRGQFTVESEKVPPDSEASAEQSDGEQMEGEEKVSTSQSEAVGVTRNESDESKVGAEVANTSLGGARAPKAVEVRPPSSSSSLLHRVILRLAKNQTYDVVKGAGPPFYPPLSRHEQPPAFEFISVALHTTPVAPIRTTDSGFSSTTARSVETSPATVDSTTTFAESAATMSDDEFDERIYDAIINGDNGLTSFAEGRQVKS